MTLGEKIAFARKRLGWSLSSLAERAGVDRISLGRIESGQTKRPQYATLERVAEALGISVNELAEKQTEKRPLAVREGYTPRFAVCRKATGHGRDEAARRLGIHEKTLAGYETCTAYPPAWMVLKMAELYGVTTDYLLGRKPDKYQGRFCRIVYCEAGLPHDRCCADCPDREGCEYKCENSPEHCNCCRTKRPDEML